MFESIYLFFKEIADPVVDKDYLSETVRKIQREVLRGKDANANRLTDLLSGLATESYNMTVRVYDATSDTELHVLEGIRIR